MEESLALYGPKFYDVPSIIGATANDGKCAPKAIVG
jgi:hypothetical protein